MITDAFIPSHGLTHFEIHQRSKFLISWKLKGNLQRTRSAFKVDGGATRESRGIDDLQKLLVDIRILTSGRGNLLILPISDRLLPHIIIASKQHVGPYNLTTGTTHCATKTTILKPELTTSAGRQVEANVNGFILRINSFGRTAALSSVGCCRRWDCNCVDCCRGWHRCCCRLSRCWLCCRGGNRSVRISWDCVCCCRRRCRSYCSLRSSCRRFYGRSCSSLRSSCRRLCSGGLRRRCRFCRRSCRSREWLSCCTGTGVCWCSRWTCHGGIILQLVTKDLILGL